MPRVTGQLLDVETVPEFIPREQGGRVRPAHLLLHVLDGKSVTRIKLPDLQRPEGLPQVGEQVDVAVVLTPYINRQNRADVSFRFDGLLPVSSPRRLAAAQG